MLDEKRVKVWEENVTIPTYEIGEPDKNPMFLEKRVYQGSSGKVYPHSVIDKIYDVKSDKTYRAVFLENKYLKIMVLPELGGRIQRATDKTNQYDFVYYNQVIKPALVGLNGPWISGGIEFNWPQHHRPSTFDPVNFKTAENEDGSCTIWVSEIENMFRTKGMAAFTLYPDKAYLEISAQLYNRTDSPKTFLWWANPAVAVNENTQSIFPPDVHAVMDHGKRDVSNFPIATGTYYKMDYSAGVDISRYKNIPVPTSYMAYHSEYNFVGGYDYGKEAGILHIADHHVSPGKKQWTWGCGEFGKAWDRNLTDEDGPYVELMTGCFTDNQPDFAWMAPYEEKTFTQYFMPYKGVGRIKNATLSAAVNLESEDGRLVIKAYVTGEYSNAAVELTRQDELIFTEQLDMTPDKAYETILDEEIMGEAADFEVKIFDQERNLLVSYRPENKELQKMPEAAKSIPASTEVRTNEDLFLFGLHLEQYRHATYEPADYYLEGLRRDPSDYRINNAYGKLLFSRGCIAKSIPYYQEAVKKLTRSNPNPYDGEALYNLGLAYKFQGEWNKAYDMFYKATWNGAWQDAGFYQLACIDAKRQDYKEALNHVDKSLIRNYHNMKSRVLKTALLRHMDLNDKAKALIQDNMEIDPMDFGSMYEEILLTVDKKKETDFTSLLLENHNTYLELSIDYMEAGLYEEAENILKIYLGSVKDSKVYPLIYYYLGYIKAIIHADEEAVSYIRLAEAADSKYCFPHRLEDILVLEKACELNPSGSFASYYLGCLWYDKKQYENAIRCFEASAAAKEDFPTVHRNLALAYYNKRMEKEAALKELARAFELDVTDARIFMELDQLHKKLGTAPEERLINLESHLELVVIRDDLYLEYITLLNTLGYHEKALSCIMDRCFHPWEGGEGRVPAQYILSNIEIARQDISCGNYEEAVMRLRRLTGSYPENLGEGKLTGAQENNIYYYLGCAYEGSGDSSQADKCFEKASTGLSEPAGMMYYNDQPPETIYYQGMALLKLKHFEEARSRFHKLIDYGRKHIFDDVKIDYFAVSLPDLQIFDEDLNRKNKIHCHFMMGLGFMGLDRIEEVGKEFETVLALDKNHTGARLLNIRLNG